MAKLGRKTLNKAIFLDRDGVLNTPLVTDGRPYAPRTIDEFKLYEGITPSLLAAKEAGYLLIVVTNQPDVARGLVAKEAVLKMHQNIFDCFPVDHIETCFETESDASTCYKPKPGMLNKSADIFNINLSESYMIGDRWRDIGAGINAGCKESIFIDRKYEEELVFEPDYKCINLQAAINYILKREKND